MQAHDGSVGDAISGWAPAACHQRPHLHAFARLDPSHMNNSGFRGLWVRAQARFSLAAPGAVRSILMVPLPPAALAAQARGAAAA